MTPTDSPPIARAEPAAVAPPERVICRFEGAEPGPTLIAVAGLHGNEPAGIHAAERIARSLRAHDAVRRGAFVAIRGNLAALAEHPEDPLSNPRYMLGDLNRLFTPRDGVPTPDLAQRDAIRATLDAIAADRRGPLYLLDLHTTSSDSPPFIAAEDSLPARRFAELFGLPIVLGVEEDLEGLLIDEATERLGCAAIAVEGGRHDDPAAVRTHEAVLRIALDSLGIADPDADPNATPTHAGEPEPAIAITRRAAGRFAHRVFDVRHREPVRALPYEPNRELSAFQPVRAGETRIATQAAAPLLAAETGLLFLPNRQRDIRVGDDAYFVVRRVGWFWLRLSALLRAREFVHAALPLVLPGVRRRPGHPRELLVDPEIAAVLRRELFHLLGYRLVRFDATPGLSKRARTARAAGLALRSLARIAENLIKRGSIDTRETNHKKAWIVRRHRLDTDRG